MIKKYIKKIEEKTLMSKFLHMESGFKLKRTPFATRVVLVYPNYYTIGMSNLGFQTVYKLINSIEGIRCERAFLPEKDNYQSKKILTIESQTPINRFDIIAFSISFENDLLSIIKILHNSNLPLLSKQRSHNAPLIMAGGVLCLLNPETLAPFIDCFLIGEVELTIKKFFAEFDPIKEKKINLLNMAYKIPSLYVPTFFKTQYTSKNTIANFNAIEKVPNTIDRAILTNLTNHSTTTSIVTMNTTFKKTFLIEVSRGCPHGCRFCSAGYIYRPTRFQSSQNLTNQIIKGMTLTNKIGLIGTAISDYPNIERICCNPAWPNTHFTFSSLRADNITNKIIKILSKNNTKTATIAPDAGSERLRKVINKGITEEDILNATKKLVIGGIPNLKMYFIVGLPSENYEDLNAIVDLCKKVKNCFLKFSRVKKKIGQITISINPFVPKPFTPFQWSAMNNISILKKKMNLVKQGLKNIANIKVQLGSIRSAYIQALIARGDRRTAKILVSAHENNFNWPKTLKIFKNEVNFYIHRKRNFDEILPWDFLNHCVSKEFLIKEYTLALNAKTSKSCYANVKNCNFCGACNNSKY